MTKVLIVFDKVINILAYIAGVLVVLTMLGIVAEVISRKLLHKSLTGVVEISEYCLLYITFFGSTWLLKRDGHVKMDIVITRMGPRQRSMMNFMTSIMCAVLCIIIAWYSALTTIDLFQRGMYLTTILETPVAPLLAPVPIGSFLLFIQFLRRANHYLSIWRGRIPFEDINYEEAAGQ